MNTSSGPRGQDSKPRTTRRSGKSLREAAEVAHRAAEAAEAAESAQLDALTLAIAQTMVRASGRLWTEAGSDQQKLAHGAALELLGATIPALAERGWTKWPARAMHRRPEWNKGHWKAEQLLTTELTCAVARQPFDKPTTTPWDSVDTLTQIVLTQIVRDMLTIALPLILEAGYSPPAPTR